MVGAMFLRPLAALVLLAGCAHPNPQKGAAESRPPEVARPALATPKETTRRVDFTRDVRPILETRCQPCHFAGGRMYEKLPFDREETIHRLGSKLFTRIKAEAEQQVIRELLAQGY